MNEKNIFDTEDLTDIPASLHKQLYLTHFHVSTKKLLALFTMQAELSINEIILGYWREYGKDKTRQWALSNLHNLVKRGLIEKVKPEPGEHQCNKRYRVKR